MTLFEINENISRLDHIDFILDAIYTENGGEETEETIALEIESVGIQQELLQPESADALGRYLKAKQLRIDERKNEIEVLRMLNNKDTLRIEGCRKTAQKLLESTGEEKVMGTLYGFAIGKTTTSYDCDNAMLKEMYQERVEEAIRKADIPAYVGVSLRGSSTLAQEESELPACFTKVEKTLARFVKPINRKKKNGDNGTV